MFRGRTNAAPLIVIFLALLTGGWFLQRGVAQERGGFVQSRLFQEVLDHISNRYVEPVDSERLYDSAIQGMLEELDDPNSSLLDVSDYESFRIQTEGDYGGVGLEITERDGFVTVVNPLPGTPGSRAGVRAGDRIVRVEGTDIEGDVERAVGLLRGQPETPVQLDVQRPGVDQTIPFTIQRARIQLRSVPFAALLDDGVGYVPLQVFNETASREVMEAVDSLLAQGAQKLVLDLRGNPGGILDQGVAVAELFLPARQIVVETRGQASEQNQVLRTSRSQRFPEIPLAVLIDERSASASEIVAGALQDHDRALVVGNTSFGKGSVQTLFRLSGGNVLKLTTAHWYTPAGRSIQAPPLSEDDSEDRRERLVLTVDGQMALRPDTAGREQVTSFAGRPLYGGGGITPDRIVMPDTLDTVEQEAVRRLFQEAGAFSLALFDYSVRFLQENPDLTPDFNLSQAHLAAFQRDLDERGVELDPQVFSDAMRYIRGQLEREIALQGFGEREEFLRRIRGSGDPPLANALDFLANSQSTAELFAAVGSPLRP